LLLLTIGFGSKCTFFTNQKEIVENRRQNFYQLEVCQQNWLRMGFEPMPALTSDVLWNRGPGNPWKQEGFRP